MGAIPCGCNFMSTIYPRHLKKREIGILSHIAKKLKGHIFLQNCLFKKRTWPFIFVDILKTGLVVDVSHFMLKKVLIFLLKKSSKKFKSSFTNIYEPVTLLQLAI